MWPESSGIPAESQLGRTGETGVLTEPPLPQRKTASMPRPQRDGSPREAERKPEPAVFSPSPVVGQEKTPPMRTHIPETENSESDASDEPGPKEDPPHLMARPASDLERDQEAAEPDQEEAGGAEPSAQLELAILNGLDISSLQHHSSYPVAGSRDGVGHPRVETEGVPGDGVPPGRTWRRALRQLE